MKIRQALLCHETLLIVCIQEVDLPIPIIFASSFKGDGEHDFLVTENLRANNYFQVLIVDALASQYRTCPQRLRF